jgi:hypothetical protein
MTDDEMRAAESLVRELAPRGCAVPIPEPFALDESRWFLRAADKGLIEFSQCKGKCSRSVSRVSASVDHFEGDDGEPHHLFTEADERHATLHREYVPAIAAYARAVLDLGYEADACRLLTSREVPRRLHRRRRPTRLISESDPTCTTSCVELCRPDGSVHLLIVATGDRRATRRLATALDVTPTLTLLTAPHSSDVDRIMASAPSFVWLVGPNTIEPESHVFRVHGAGTDTRVSRVHSVPAPA